MPRGDLADNRSKGLTGLYFSPFRLLALTVLSVFVGEAAVMLLLARLPPLSVSFRAFLDSILLVVIVLPVLYFLELRPLVLHLRERRRGEEEREKLVAELQRSLAEVRALSGLLPICASCKKIRDEGGAWNQMEVYISARSETKFSHTICPECILRLYGTGDAEGLGRNERQK